jgi:hypothetical protein
LKQINPTLASSSDDPPTAYLPNYSINGKNDEAPPSLHRDPTAQKNLPDGSPVKPAHAESSYASVFDFLM